MHNFSSPVKWQKCSYDHVALTWQIIFWLVHLWRRWNVMWWEMFRDHFDLLRPFLLDSKRFLTANIELVSSLTPLSNQLCSLSKIITYHYKQQQQQKTNKKKLRNCYILRTNPQSNIVSSFQCKDSPSEETHINPYLYQHKKT